jgi:hypothetical protein
MSFSKLRRFIADRRKTLRFPHRRIVEVMAGVSGSVAGRATLFCNTIDLGEEGMSVLVRAPALGLFEAGEGQQLRVVLSLPDGPITMLASTVYVRAIEWEGVSGHAVGLRITGASDEERERLLTFLRELR